LWRLRLGEAGRRAVPAWRAVCFLGALLTVALALLSPLDALGETLFGAHMFQHMLLAYGAAPLLVLGRPLLVTSLGIPPGLRRRLWSVRVAVTPSHREAIGWAVFAIGAHIATFWAWHLPGLYQAALRSEVVHIVEHTTLLAGSLALWWLVADARGRHANAAGVFALFVGMLQSGVLAALLTFGPIPWYAEHADGARAWNLTPLADQQVAGGLMWFPGGLVYIVGGAVLFLRWLREDERAASFAQRAARGRV
ncbi:MAG: cytochrome c oxidase assembly protein, partial [Actinomycetota bacterium]|nr:cytochrome c oxidase assembly protein [Actinomycetota bacterium]